MEVSLPKVFHSFKTKRSNNPRMDNALCVLKELLLGVPCLEGNPKPLSVVG